MTFANLSAVSRRFSNPSAANPCSRSVAHRHKPSRITRAFRVITCKRAHPQAARPEKHDLITVGKNIYKPNRPLAVIESAQSAIELIVFNLTPAIRAKAQELGHNPVQIHNWLLTNITWQPTWGAMQSADSVLSSQRGNAVDIASLHIALLRASSIPARYQFGTIELTAAQAQNWAGNLQTPQAAQQIMGQGGIATRGIIEGGKISKIRMEHVWVNAYVNWAPSRGARQGGAVISTPGGSITTAPHGAAQHPSPNPALNAWVPMDASYKQYSYAAGMNLQQSVPLDATALLAAAQQGATVNAQEGWVQNLNQANLQTELTNYQARLQAHINSTPTGASSTVGDVIGRQSIPAANYQQLAGSLPYATVQTGQLATSIPASLQHRFTYQVNDQYGQELLTYNERVAHINGKRLTLSYIPATQADADLIASYLPRPNADGSPIRPEQLPTSLPGYLIRLKPQINLDGAPVATSAQAVQMGSDLPSSGGFTSQQNIASWDITTDGSNVAGQATAIGISAGGISAAQLNNLKTRLQNTQTQLQAAQANPNTATATLAGITGEQISGDLLTATIWSWFAAAESHNRLSQNQAGMVEVPALSYGLFHAVAQPIYSWGIVRQVKFPGVNLDIGHVRNISWATDNDNQKWIAYNRLRGQYMSALEHAIPERFFNDPQQCNTEGSTTQTAGLPVCPQGISAVKALALAAAQGQKIYTITREVYNNNPSIVSQKLSAHSIDTRQRVQQNLDAGIEVTIHEAPITQSGWSGAGYTTIDPNTGAGGYLIDGGSNGGVLSDDFWGRYLAWVNNHMITNGFILSAALMLAPFVSVTKAFFGFSSRLLGGSNLYTTFLRGLAVTFGWTAVSAFAATLGPFLAGPVTLLIVFIGFFNLATLIAGLFYAETLKRDVLNFRDNLFADGSCIGEQSSSCSSLKIATTVRAGTT